MSAENNQPIIFQSMKNARSDKWVFDSIGQGKPLCISEGFSFLHFLFVDIFGVIYYTITKIKNTTEGGTDMLIPFKFSDNKYAIRLAAIVLIITLVVIIAALVQMLG